jgi:hypothetical protein
MFRYNGALDFGGELMTRTACIFVTLLACSACSAPGSSAPAAVSAPAAAAGVQEKKGEMGIESHVVLKQFASAQTEMPIANLKPGYPDKDSFLGDVKANRPPQAIALDGITVWEGFGPAARYHTNKDGSISR